MPQTTSADLPPPTRLPVDVIATSLALVFLTILVAGLWMLHRIAAQAHGRVNGTFVMAVALDRTESQW